MDSTRQGDAGDIWVSIVNVCRHGILGGGVGVDTSVLCVWVVVRVGGGLGRGGACAGGGVGLHPPYFEHARAAWRVRWGVGARFGWFFGPPMLALGLCVGVCVWGVFRGVWRRYFRLPLVREVAHIVLRVALWFGVHPCMQYKAGLLCGD
jgi:hypothetical protein